jgi:hypothetical protein
VLRRLDCVLEATKPKVLAEFTAKKKEKLNPDPFLLRASSQSFYNTLPMDMGKLMGGAKLIAIQGVSEKKKAKGQKSIDRTSSPCSASQTPLRPSPSATANARPDRGSSCSQDLKK